MKFCFYKSKEISPKSMIGLHYKIFWFTLLLSVHIYYFVLRSYYTNSHLHLNHIFDFNLRLSCHQCLTLMCILKGQDLIFLSLYIHISINARSSPFPTKTLISIFPTQTVIALVAGLSWFHLGATRALFIQSQSNTCLLRVSQSLKKLESF